MTTVRYQRFASFNIPVFKLQSNYPEIWRFFQHRLSALLAYEKGLDYNLIFADTRIENEDLYRFNNDIAEACQKEIVHLQDGRTPWDVYEDKAMSLFTIDKAISG